jgi:hypothetical protein
MPSCASLQRVDHAAAIAVQAEAAIAGDVIFASDTGMSSSVVKDQTFKVSR